MGSHGATAAVGLGSASGGLGRAAACGLVGWLASEVGAGKAKVARRTSRCPGGGQNSLAGSGSGGGLPERGVGGRSA